MKIEDRPYQQKCIQKCMEHFQRGVDSVMLESPVGSGKTIMGLSVVQRLNELRGGGLSCAWVAPRHTLLEQLVEANQEFRLDITPVSMFARTAPHYDIVVLDEAHHEATSSFIRLFQDMSPTYLLGLSATPLRTDRMKLAFKETVNVCSIRSLILDGYLSQFQLFNIEKMDPENAAFHYLRDPKKWGKTIVFMPTLKECSDFQLLLRNAGVECPVVKGGQNNDDILDDFRSGRHQVIVNCHLLTEGFDLPELRTVFLKDSTRLPTIQMAGRVLRKAPKKPFANIVQSKETRYQAHRIAEPQTVWLWRDQEFQAVSGRNDKVMETVLHYLELRDKRKEIRLPKCLFEYQSVERIYA